MHYDELKELGSEAAVKAAGKYRQEGEPCSTALTLTRSPPYLLMRGLGGWHAPQRKQ